MRVYGYLRVSSVSQADGDGPERQKLAISTFCATHSIELIDWFFDSHTGTAECLDRPGFAAMLEAVADERDATGVVDGIIAENMTRLARDLMVSEMLLSQCRKLGLKVFCADQPTPLDIATNSSDPSQTLIRQMLAAVSQWEKTALVIKLRASRERIRAATGRCEGRKPFGHRPGEKAIIEVIRGYYQSGMQFNDLARFLNGGGFVTRSHSSWTKSSAKRCVRTLQARGFLPVDTAPEV